MRLPRVLAAHGPVFLPLALASQSGNSSVPRNVLVQDGKFIDRKTGQVVLLQGANVVMKGPPWLPEVKGDTICMDHWWSNFTCYTFNKHDAQHITREMGWNYIRLGVVWAGGQPTPEPQLDPEFLRRLHAILELCDEYGIHVVLDIHQDAMGTATCGEGVPQWFSALATPGRIGEPLRVLPGFSFLWPEDPGNCTDWQLFAGDVSYNYKNPCCLRYNGGGNAWSRLEFTWQAQETFHYLFHQGRDLYARYAGLLARAVAQHPAAIGIELMNEPPSIERAAMYHTWQAAYEAIRAEVPYLAVGVMDIGQAPLPIGGLGLLPSQARWLREASHLFYAFHWYSFPPDPVKAVAYAKRFEELWGMPSLMTEMGECKVKVPAVQNGIGWSYWEYSNYCDTVPSNACLPGGACDFGACITGTNGNSWKNLTCDGSELEQDTPEKRRWAQIMKAKVERIYGPLDLDSEEVIV